MLTKEEIIEKIPHLSAMLNEIGAWPEVLQAMDEYANQDKWISAKELPNTNEVGKKILLFRKMNEGQREMAITVYDTFLVKHCDPETTFWQPLPNAPKQ